MVAWALSALDAQTAELWAAELAFVAACPAGTMDEASMVSAAAAAAAAAACTLWWCLPQASIFCLKAALSALPRFPFLCPGGSHSFVSSGHVCRPGSSHRANRRRRGHAAHALCRRWASQQLWPGKALPLCWQVWRLRVHWPAACQAGTRARETLCTWPRSSADEVRATLVAGGCPLPLITRGEQAYRAASHQAGLVSFSLLVAACLQPFPLVT